MTPPLPAAGSRLEAGIALSFSYPVIFTRGTFDPANPVLAEAITRLEPGRRHRVAVVIDQGVADAWPDLSDRIPAYGTARDLEIAGIRIVPGGEAVKDGPAHAAALQDWLLALAIDRHSLLMAIGGGAVLDMAGYAAATFHRGVRLLRLPTTVLAQNDAGVGVKNGVNQAGVKNLIGTFAPPFAVIADGDFLATLPARDRRAGLAEAVKVAAIRDAAFFDWLTGQAAALAMFEETASDIMIRRSAALHLDHITGCGDPFEMGSARPLDFGHWAAHRLETLSGHRLRHGEAVAIGMTIDALYAVETGLMPAADATRLVTLLEALDFPLWDNGLAARGTDGRRLILKGIEDFREHLGGRLTIAMLSEIGRAVDIHHIDLDTLEIVLTRMERQEQRRCA